VLVLYTDRLSLRNPVLSDVAALASYHSSEAYLQYYDRPPNTQKIIEMAIQWASQEPRENFQLIIELVGKGEVIGCAGFRTESYPNGEAEIGIEVHPDYWGRGYATESLVALIELARSQSISKLHALTNESNTRAIELTKMVGFTSAAINNKLVRLSLNLVSEGSLE
jgi:ribosomal-protein-alanine N-acetyltransferase